MCRPPRLALAETHVITWLSDHKKIKTFYTETKHEEGVHVKDLGRWASNQGSIEAILACLANPSLIHGQSCWDPVGQVIMRHRFARAASSAPPSTPPSCIMRQGERGSSVVPRLISSILRSASLHLTCCPYTYGEESDPRQPYTES